MKVFQSTYLVLLFFVIGSCHQEPGIYRCYPCNLDCDEVNHKAPGYCPSCNMKLIAAKELQSVKIEKGKGYFDLVLGNQKLVSIFYYKPESFSENSEILMVIPGSGRSADSYRETWIDAADEYGLLIVSIMFPERYYGFEEYHLGGLIKNSNLIEQITETEITNVLVLNEDAMMYEVNPIQETWIYQDIEQVFDTVRFLIAPNKSEYLIFGHSAGGHILHRMAIFRNNSRAKRIIASNASFYTFPDSTMTYPFGLSDSPVREEDLASAFKKELYIVLGEEDNAEDVQGTFLRSTSADLQGKHRLERGVNFYIKSQELAHRNNWKFNWKLEVIPGVGHDQEKIGKASLKYMIE